MPDPAHIDSRQACYSWNFSTNDLKDLHAFVAEFSDYNQAVAPDAPIEDFVLINAGSVIVRFAGLPEPGSSYEDMEVIVRSANGEVLRFWEFMHQLHQQVHRYLLGADHVFFEGVTYRGMRNGVPVVELQLGS